MEKAGLSVDAQRVLSKFMTDQNAGLTNGYWSTEKINERLAKAKLWCSKQRQVERYEQCVQTV